MSEEIFGPDGERTIYLIPERNFPKFEKQMETLSKRSQKLGFLPIKPILFGQQQVKDTAGNVQKDRNGRPQYVLEIYLTADMPKIEGWTFVARIDHANESGNIVRAVPNSGVELPHKYRTTAPECDHCRINRKRRDTFVIHCDETGEFMQVGSSCLVDFFGHDPLKIAKLAEILGYADEVGRAATSGEFVMQDKRWIDTSEFIAYCATSIRQRGFFSSRAGARATRRHAFDLMYPADETLRQYKETNLDSYQDMVDAYRAAIITAEDAKLAREAIEWAQSLSERPTMNEYLHNISVIANSVVMESRTLGYAASIISAYQREQRDAQQATARAQAEETRRAEAMARANLNTEVGDFSGVIALMRGETTGSKLRFPKIRLQLDDNTPVVLAIAGSQARCPGTVNVTNGAEYGSSSNIWFGRVTPQGRYEPNKSATYVTTATATAVAALLSRLAKEPAKVAAEYGKITGRCCMCNLPLNDPRSAFVGYGATCAKNAGWPYPTAKQVRIATEAA